MATNNNIWCIIPAGGVGSRMQSTQPKQYLCLLENSSVLDYSMQAMIDAVPNAHYFIGISDQDNFYQQRVNASLQQQYSRFSAGEERVNTVDAGIQAIKSSPEYLALSKQQQSEQWLLVHDAARPCVAKADIQRLIDYCLAKERATKTEQAVENQDSIFAGAILAKPIADTIKTVAGSKHKDSGIINATVDRNNYIAALTPQLVKLEVLAQALAYVKESNKLDLVTDESSAIELFGKTTDYLIAEYENPKITYPQDLAYAKWLLGNSK